LDTGAALASSAATSEDVEAEEVAEDVVEIVEDGFVEAAASVGGNASVAEAVVSCALVAVGEDRVGLGGFLEAFFCGVISWVAIGVMLHGELAIGTFDFLLACPSFYA